MKATISRLLLFRNANVYKRYSRFLNAHPRLSRKANPILWTALLWWNVRCRLPFPEKRTVRFGMESSTRFAMSAEKLAEKLCQYDVISFDMFDTLILRPVAVPTDLFSFIGDHLGIADFRELRTRAEQDARKQMLHLRHSPEITLSQIYELLETQTGIPAETGAAAECRTERDACLPNPYFQTVWKLLRAAGKRIIITTDMYLPEAVLAEMLEKCGFTGYEALFVSCVWGEGKHSGNLYQIIQQKCGTGRYLHVGDNPISDVVNAKANGWDAVHYPNLQELGAEFRPEGMSERIGSVYSAVLNRRFYAMERVSPAFAFGYQYGGLLTCGGWHLEDCRRAWSGEWQAALPYINALFPNENTSEFPEIQAGKAAFATDFQEMTAAFPELAAISITDALIPLQTAIRHKAAFQKAYPFLTLKSM